MVHSVAILYDILACKEKEALYSDAFLRPLLDDFRPLYPLALPP